jgi:hypothetical protein
VVLNVLSLGGVTLGFMIAGAVLGVAFKLYEKHKKVLKEKAELQEQLNEKDNTIQQLTRALAVKEFKQDSSYTPRHFKLPSSHSSPDLSSPAPKLNTP